MEYTPLENLEIGQRGCKIKARVARLWDSTNPSLNDQLMSVDFLLVDEQGKSIEASIRKEDATRMRELIFEGGVYTIANFIVAAARRTYRVSPHQNMLRIGTWTIIKKVDDPEITIPLNTFSFITEDTLDSRLYNDVYLTDIIGHLISVGRLTQIYANGRMVGKKNVVIQTLRNESIDVTLWGAVGQEFNEEEALKIPKKDPIIIVLTAMTVKSFKAKITLSTTSATKIYLNLNIEEVHQFRRSLPYPNEVIILQDSQQSTQTINTVDHKEEKTISQLLSLNRGLNLGKQYHFFGTIIDIDASKGWWYSACARCKAGVNNYEGIISCRKCGPNSHLPIPWYKVNLSVTDDTGSATLLMFGKQVEKIINVPASVLSEFADSNKTTIPEIMKQILGKKYGFIVSINERDNHPKILSFNVSNIFEPHNKMHTLDEKKISDIGPSTNTVAINDVFVNINNKRDREKRDKGKMQLKKKGTDAQEL